MSATIAVDDLRVGMFVHLDLGWWAHPFALSSFRLTTPEQIATIRGLGVKRLRWSPEKSTLKGAQNGSEGGVADVATADAPPVSPGDVVAGAALAPGVKPDDVAPPAGGAEPDGDAATAAATIEPVAIDPEARAAQRRREQLAAQREANRICARQYNEAAASWQAAMDVVADRPEAARETTEGLTRALLIKMMVDGELCIRVLAEVQTDRATAHALNVAVVSLLMGRAFGFSAAEMLDVGVGALLHDVGKLELPERVRMPDAQAPAPDQALYREHVARGLAQGKRMGLTAGALLVLAQHHEMADGSGFPQRLNVDRMTGAARIVALVNRYDNLCDPAIPAHALTPHEALSLIFAQTRAKFDASMLNAFIRMMGVYPPGSVVQLTDDRFALVTNVNSSRPLKPRVLVYDPQVPADEALQINLELHSDLGIRRSLRPQQLPPPALKYLSPRQRVIYFFEPAQITNSGFGQEIAS
ncbi:MAG: DUF3391 domain-containing protein [Ideonella sp.]|nr:DUF3391 domain-containing protein [Ideonella sp.]MCC7457807.1 DUF3391 domain-containing protein [Nitrospira sp.]